MRYAADVKESSLWKIQCGDWHLYQGFYGKANLVEANFSFQEETFRAFLALDYSVYGGYAVRISREKGRDMAILFTNAIRYVTIAYAYLDEFDIELKAGVIFHAALCRKGNEFAVMVEGKEVIRHTDLNARPDHSIGKCGYVVYPLRGNTTKIESFCLDGEAANEPVEIKQIPMPCHYVMEIPTADGQIPPCWEKEHESEGFFTKNGVFASRKAHWAQSFLYQFDHDPCLTVHFAVDDLDEEGQFGFFLRRAPQTAFVKVAYSASKKCWYIDDTPAVYDCYNQIFEGIPWMPETGREYLAQLSAKGDHISLTIDGSVVLDVANVRQTASGKTGVFSQNAAWHICSFEAELASGIMPMEGAFSYCIDDGPFLASVELEHLPNGKLIGISKPKRYASDDGGLTFYDASEEYAGMDAKNYYQTILRIHDGTYLQVLAHSGGEIQSSDDLKNWKTIGYLGDEKDRACFANENYIFHTNSMTEIEKPDGGRRLFMPIGVRTCDNDMPVYSGVSHDTFCFYSDDGGHTWNKSNWVSDIFGRNGGYIIDWCESKVIHCDDGTLRMYCSRNSSRFFTAIESKDLGKSWERVVPIRQIQCSKASFGIDKDPQNPNTWYAACVNDTPLARGNTQNRTQLSLYRTHNGKDWEFLTDVQRFGVRFADEPDMENRPIFQIVDPCVHVDDKYVYVTWGNSISCSRGAASGNQVANPAGSKVANNEQRPHFARFEKDKLIPHPWSAATIANPGLLEADLSDEMW